MKIVYEIEDGYAGKSRPQSVQIYNIDEIIEDHIDDPEKIIETIYDVVYEDMLSKISFYIKNHEKLVSYIAEKIRENK